MTVQAWFDGAADIIIYADDGYLPGGRIASSDGYGKLTYEVKPYTGVPNFTHNGNVLLIVSGTNVRIKFERGNKATDWTPAPEDVDANISTAQSIADNANTNAGNAQSTANTAVGDAATAQNTANSAKSTAESKTDEWVTQITKDTVTAEFLRTRNLVVGDHIQMGPDAVIAWDKVTGGQAAVDAIEIGGRNLVLNSDTKIESNAYKMGNLYLSRDIQDGELLTITFHGEIADGKYIYVGQSPSSALLTAAIKIKDGVYRATFIFNKNSNYPNDLNNKLGLWNAPKDTFFTGFISNVKLEIGNKATDWTPAPEDVDASINAAQAAAKAYALAKANLAETTAKAYADGVVSAEEQRAINDAQARANAAKTAAISTAAADASSKANAAQTAAKAYALAKANLAETTAKAHADDVVSAEEQRAIDDAQARANAAKTAAISTAAADASSKANAAQAAAKAYALAKANLAETTAKAYADGVVSAEEQRAINDAQARANAAKTAAISTAAADASSKANAAQTAAKAYALAKANLAETTAKAHADDVVSAEEQRAIDDAQARANAAKTAAISTAAADASSKANAAQAAAKAYALAKANLAETTAKAYADGVVSAEEQRAINDAQARANAAKTAAISTAAADASSKANAAQTAATSVANAAQTTANSGVTKANSAYTLAGTKVTSEQATQITRDTITTTNIVAENLQVNAINIKGVLIASQINFDNAVGKNVTLTGKINAVSGSFGGFSINSWGFCSPKVDSFSKIDFDSTNGDITLSSKKTSEGTTKGSSNINFWNRVLKTGSYMGRIGISYGYDQNNRWGASGVVVESPKLVYLTSSKQITLHSKDIMIGKTSCDVLIASNLRIGGAMYKSIFETDTSSSYQTDDNQNTIVLKSLTDTYLPYAPQRGREICIMNASGNSRRIRGSGNNIYGWGSSVVIGNNGALTFLFTGTEWVATSQR